MLQKRVVTGRVKLSDHRSKDLVHRLECDGHKADQSNCHGVNTNLPRIKIKAEDYLISLGENEINGCDSKSGSRKRNYLFVESGPPRGIPGLWGRPLPN